MVMVPNVLPGTPVPDREPVVIYMSDKFTEAEPIPSRSRVRPGPSYREEARFDHQSRVSDDGMAALDRSLRRRASGRRRRASRVRARPGKAGVWRRGGAASVPSWSPSTGRLVVQASAMPRPSKCPSTVRPLPRSYPVCSSRSDVIAASAATAPPDTWGSHSGASLAAETRLCVDVRSWTRTLADSNPTQRGPASPPSGRELGSGRR